MTRLLHPWFSLGFVVVLRAADPELARADDVDARRSPLDAANQDLRDQRQRQLEPEYVGFFNGGQKLYFWAIVASALVFLIVGHSDVVSARPSGAVAWRSVTCCTMSPRS